MCVSVPLCCHQKACGNRVVYWEFHRLLSLTSRGDDFRSTVARRENIFVCRGWRYFCLLSPDTFPSWAQWCLTGIVCWWYFWGRLRASGQSGISSSALKVSLRPLLCPTKDAMRPSRVTGSSYGKVSEKAACGMPWARNRHSDVQFHL